MRGRKNHVTSGAIEVTAALRKNKTGMIDLFFAESIFSRRAVLDNRISIASLGETKAAKRFQPESKAP